MMNRICHHSVYFKYMPYLPGIEFSVNSFNILLLGEILMYPIRFIKVMGRSKNNYGQVAFYQASTVLPASLGGSYCLSALDSSPPIIIKGFIHPYQIMESSSVP
mmetsp:Transcript_10267/g.14154  ORF Transcript_10267/g.14154 Transcript_10267/m.14154 type:complete len:104 (+) Transcript_10267:1392-1703(+)